MTLAFEDANSKLLDVVSVAEVDAKERVDNSLVEIMKLMFEEILKLKICQDFEANLLSIWSLS